MSCDWQAEERAVVLAERLVLLGAALTHVVIQGDLNECAPLLGERELVLNELTHLTLNDPALRLLGEAVEQEKSFQALLGRHLSAMQDELGDSFRDRTALQGYAPGSTMTKSIGQVA